MTDFDSRRDLEMVEEGRGINCLIDFAQIVSSNAYVDDEFLLGAGVGNTVEGGEALFHAYWLTGEFARCFCL